MSNNNKAALNFSPYSEPPDHARASAGATSPPEAGPSTSSYQAGGGIESLHGQSFGSTSHHKTDSFGAGYSTAVQPGDYDTRFGWRCDMMACSAYLLGPLSAIPILLLETHNNFVRFHAYQALFLSIGLGCAHLLLLWSHWLTRLMLLVDIVVIVLQIRTTHQDADTLRRRFLPYIGEVSSNWVEEE